MTRDMQTKTGDDSSSKWTEEDIFAMPSSASDARTSPIGAIAEDDMRGLSLSETDSQFFPYSYSGPFRGASEPAVSSDTYTAESQPPAQSVSAEPRKTEDAEINSFFNNAYSLLPRGLISTVMSKPDARSPEEQALYDYGNAVGANIKVFEGAHKDSTALKNFFPDSGGFKSGDPVAVDAVLTLASDYSQLGNTIANMDSVPESAKTLNAALAKSYSDVGSGLASIANTKADGDITQVILAYDNSAGIFIKNFVALAEFFSARGIKFSGSDPGSVFQFSR